MKDLFCTLVMPSIAFILRVLINLASSLEKVMSWCLLLTIALISTSTLGLDDLFIKESSLFVADFFLGSVFPPSRSLGI
jgi:hypothetical protein